MVVVEFAYEDMSRLIDLPRDRMVAYLSDLGAPSEYEAEVDKIIVELTPNRPDWYSMEGLARALRAYTKKEKRAYSTKKSDYLVRIDPSVEKIRPFTVCAIIKGLSLDDRRIRDLVLLQEKLLGTLGRRVKKFGLGLYPLHAIRFPLKYTTMDPSEIRYIPLGYEEVMDADDILEKHKKGQQYGGILKGQMRYPVFVDADDRIMALIPIVNSQETGKVDEKTKDIFIEVTGTEMHSCNAALNILACTFADMGGQVYEVRLDYGKKKITTPDLSERVVDFDLAQANKILGLGLKEKEVGELLAKMGFGYKKGKVSVPPYRADILGQIDIIEDIAIAYGYNRFAPTTPDFFNPGIALKSFDEVDAVMRGMGFTETKTFILTNKERLDLVGGSQEAVEIANPGNADYTVVRTNLLVDMLETLKINKMKGLPQRFYEIGIVHDGKSASKRLIFGIMDKELEFSSVRGYLQTIAAERGFSFALQKKKAKAFDPGLSCAVLVDGKEKGVFGKISSELLQKEGLEFQVYVCELWL
ncbi:MAG: phenylalanine--tRNA ligase subunit beta [Candidatus Micrarchaeota archaeon]